MQRLPESLGLCSDNDDETDFRKVYSAYAACLALVQHISEAATISYT